MRIAVIAAFVLLLSVPVVAQGQGQAQETIDPVERYNHRLAVCADCYGKCAHRWDPRRLSEELERVGSRARRECEERCAAFMRLGENECRGAYLGRTLGAR